MAPLMKIVLLSGTVAVASVLTTVCLTHPEHSSTVSVEHGAYLIESFGCGDCHTPKRLGPQGPEPDLALALAGHPEHLTLPAPPALPDGPWMVTVAGSMTAWSGPWGISYSSNLTPDDETGIGRWTEREFVDTMRSGRHLGRGREILPPMPIPAVRNLTDDDLASMFAYLRSRPAVRNHVPDPMPPTVH